MVVMTAVRTGQSTSRMPLFRRLEGILSLLSACVVIASPTTIASSTMMPSTMIRPKRLIMLIVCPLAAMMPNAPPTDTPIPSTTQKLNRKSITSSNDRNTRMMPQKPLLFEQLNCDLRSGEMCRTTGKGGGRSRGKVACRWSYPVGGDAICDLNSVFIPSLQDLKD